MSTARRGGSGGCPYLIGHDRTCDGVIFERIRSNSSRSHDEEWGILEGSEVCYKEKRSRA